ncbi:3'-5'-exoribonuclease [Malassezia sp. CBS 17886]|nr:3'-5'-exoribonuclease [Malassezia sp. CBS 17886]
MAAVYDRRRANGPEDTRPPLYTVAVSADAVPEHAWPVNEHRLLSNAQSVPPASLRLRETVLDGIPSAMQQIVRTTPSTRESTRGAMEPRPLYVQTGIVVNASGSALLESGHTKLVCAVHGPRQVRGRQYAGNAELNVFFQMAPHSDVDRHKPGKDTELAGPAAHVRQALLPAVRLDLLPKSSIDVHVTVLDQDTSLLGCAALAVTAASAALAEAGIELYGLVTGATASASVPLPEPDTPVQEWFVDPSGEDAAHASTHLLLCTMPSLGRTTCYVLQGPAYDLHKLQEVSDALCQVTAKVHSVVAQSLQGSA